MQNSEDVEDNGPTYGNPRYLLVPMGQELSLMRISLI